MFFKKNQNKKTFVFMDHAAGTAIDPDVFSVMKPFFIKVFFNPSSIYNEGFHIREHLYSARKSIARHLSCQYKNIIFCDGGTEANNLVLRGLVRYFKKDNPDIIPHIITSVIEHASVLETCRDLENHSEAEISYISVNEHGVIDIKELKGSIKENTILVSVGYVNGEIGTIQDIQAIAKTIRHYRKHNNSIYPYFHTDAVQAVNYCDVKTPKLGIDYMTINASKIYGPKKIAALYKKTSAPLKPIITGGSQEFGLRAGTENIPYIIGLEKALEKTLLIQDSECEGLSKLRDYMEDLLREKLNVPFVVNGGGANRIPNIVNISIPDLSSEEIILRLDAIGVKASVKSACKSDEEGDSHVIRALRNENTQSIRFSMGRSTRKRDINYLVDELVRITNNMQETYNKFYEKK